MTWRQTLAQPPTEPHTLGDITHHGVLLKQTFRSLQSLVALLQTTNQATPTQSSAKGDLCLTKMQACTANTLQFALRFGPQDFPGAPLGRTPVGTTRHCPKQ